MKKISKTTVNHIFLFGLPIAIITIMCYAIIINFGIAAFLVAVGFGVLFNIITAVFVVFLLSRQIGEKEQEISDCIPKTGGYTIHPDGAKVIKI